jgi:hypothetical protein
MKRPTKKEVQFLRIALGMSGIATTDIACEIIISVQKEMKRLGTSKFSLKDGARIEDEVLKYYTISQTSSKSTQPEPKQ